MPTFFFSAIAAVLLGELIWEATGQVMRQFREGNKLPRTISGGRGDDL
jgi:hypothetical protein